MSHQPEINTHQVYRRYEDHTPPQIHTNQPYPNQSSVVKLFRCQTELTQSTQCLHQKITDTLNSITRSSSHQENLHFINDIPISKATDPQSFDNWLEQIDRFALLTKIHINSLVQNFKAHLAETISSYPPTLG